MLETWSEVDFGDQSKGFVHGSLKIFIDDNFGMTASLMVEIKDRPSYSTVITKYNIVAMQQPTGQIVFTQYWRFRKHIHLYQFNIQAFLNSLQIFQYLNSFQESEYPKAIPLCINQVSLWYCGYNIYTSCFQGGGKSKITKFG